VGKYIKKRMVLVPIVILMMMSSGCALFRFLPVPYEDLSVETREPINITLEPIQENIVTPTAVDLLVVPVIITEEISREGTAPRHIIQVRYPQIETQVLDTPAFNAKVEQMMNEFVQSFLDEISGTEFDDSAQEFVNGLTSDYRLTYIDSKQISINFLQSVYFAGAAHPLPFSRTINYDLRSDRVMELDEVFVEGADYITRISEFALTDLRQQGVLEWEEGAAPSSENFESWNITLEGLLFTFDPYQVAPYAAGFQEVLIPYEVLSDILRDGGPVPPLDF
jgi:hypothetical protein